GEGGRRRQAAAEGAEAFPRGAEREGRHAARGPDPHRGRRGPEDLGRPDAGVDRQGDRRLQAAVLAPGPLRMYGSKILEQLIEELVKLPTIGQKSAQRLALHLLRAPREDALRLAESIRALREKVGLCGTCGNFAESDP